MNRQVFIGKVRGTRGAAHCKYRLVIVVDGAGPDDFKEGQKVEVRKEPK